jgi:hypothetical protein
MRSNRLSYAPEVSEIIAQVNGFGKILLIFYGAGNHSSGLTFP